MENSLEQNRQLIRQQFANNQLINTDSYDVIDRNLAQFNTPQLPQVVQDFGMFDVEAKLQNLIGDRENRMNNLIGMTNNTPIEVEAKLNTQPLFNITDRLLGTQQQIDPAEKIRRMLEW